MKDITIQVKLKIPEGDWCQYNRDRKTFCQFLRDSPVGINYCNLFNEVIGYKPGNGNIKCFQCKKAVKEKIKKKGFK